MKGNPICINIPWYTNEDHLSAWEEGRTGYPFIDACMRQLRKVSNPKRLKFLVDLFSCMDHL